MFERTIVDVTRRLEAIGLGHVVATVRRIRAVTEESYHDSRNLSIGLNPSDLGKPYAAFHRAPYLLVHELGHHFAETCLTTAERRSLRGVFGDYDAPYHRRPKPRHADADHVSRYSMTHPAEDFAETFAVLLWRLWDEAAVDGLLRSKSAACRAKVALMERLVAASRARGRIVRVPPSR
ncbi:MAG TPA: putative zinc-binding metallopeptidase [Spirochaetia bacterium]